MVLPSIAIPETFAGRPYAADHFRALVEWARAEHPFYRGWLAGCGEVPLIDRATFLEHNDEILAGYPVTATTSGSTGIPVRLSQGPGRVRLEGEAQARFVGLLGGPLPRVRLVRPFPGDDDPGLLDVVSPLEEQMAFIRKRHEEAGAVAVTTYPTNAELLSRAILEAGLDFGFVKRFGMFAETLEPYQEALVREAFPRAAVWTTYSAMEVGLIAFRCPYEPAFHHVTANVLGVEVLDEAGNPCPAGVPGRVVITDYFNRRSPFIRYEIGDLAERGHCPCGRIPLPALGRIHGKVRGALRHRDGRRVMFTNLSVALRDVPGMRQCQVIQHAIGSFTAKVVVAPSVLLPRVEEQVAAAFREHFGYVPEELRVERVEGIERDRSGKFHYSICEV